LLPFRRDDSLIGMEEALSTDESMLVTALRAGEPSAFERLVREHGGRLLAVAERLLANREDAREALQDALLAAFRSIKSFDGRARLTTWLHRIVINAALMKRRSKRRHPEQQIEELLPAFLADGHQAGPVSRWNDSGAELSQRNEMQQIVREKIDGLPESYRIVLMLRDIEEIDTETVAEMLELTPGAVKVRLHRARQALRTLLDPVFGKGSQ